MMKRRGFIRIVCELSLIVIKVVACIIRAQLVVVDPHDINVVTVLILDGNVLFGLHG